MDTRGEEMVAAFAYREKKNVKASTPATVQLQPLANSRGNIAR
jgi:hypothetical protein